MKANRFLVTSAVMAWLAAMAAPAYAQSEASRNDQAPLANSADDEEDEAILVTGSRIDRPGFEAPTPTTVLGEAELRMGGRNNVAEVLADVPQVRFTNNPVSNVGNITVGAGSGSASSDIRGLGTARTLVLLNGRRFSGDGDLTNIPFAAVRRIDVVTGGASAAYGSDAVAGVVNVILDDSFDRVELTAQAGISGLGDAEEYRFSAVGGTNFAGGRGNILVSGEYFETGGIPSRLTRPNVALWGTLGNPANPSEILVVPDVRLAMRSRGGLILSGVLSGQTFEPNGTLRTFQRGSIVSGNSMSGGEGPANGEEVALIGETKRINLFGRVRYDLSDEIRVVGDVRYSHAHTTNELFPQSTVFTIRAENAFLPAAVRQLLPAGSQFSLGRFNTDFGVVQFDIERETIQGTLALEGQLGANWRWDAYYTHGESRTFNQVRNSPIASNLAEAVDVVAGPGGAPICRSRLTVPTTACQPLNLFGQGAPSRAALDYVLGTGTEDGEERLDVGAVSLRGEPFSLWAGPVSVAFGGEIRRTSLDSVVDALSSQARFSLFNFAPLSGSVKVKEAFGEIVVPLVRDVPLLQLLEVNAAARVSDYSTSGTVWSWKVGATNRLMDGWRVRGVISRDIRAPNVGELFTTRSQQGSTVNDPFRGNATTAINTFTGGNPDLRPERSLTYSIGTIFEPSFAPGLSASVDFYNIDIKDAITTLQGSAILTRCFAGSPQACSAITRAAPGPGETFGPITEIQATFINLNRFETSGVDFELAYRMPADRLFGSAPGSLQFRLLGTWVDELIQDDALVEQDFAGNVGSSRGIPHWRAVGSVSYESDDLGLDLRGRYVGGGELAPGQNVVDQQVDAALYFDLGFRFGVPTGTGKDSKFEFFGSVTNLFDKDSPPVTSPAIFDPIGRFFNFGARVRF